jgi:(1->4)-alpha-D-glucan 1-alpha-D-glucosylmutase
MSDPSSTYRLQFRNGMTFGRAAELAPYLVRLGISHVYGSPIFQAEPNSNHGYDVSDNRVLDRKLGGDASFESMIAAFHDAGLRFILDFVPNHMSASPRNPYWRDVLEWGQASDYAPFFDIDWSAPKLLVPVLGTSYGKALRAREFGLNFDEEDGSLTYTYRDLELPLTPTSYAQVLVREQSKESSDWARRFAVATPETSTELKANLATAAQNTTMRRALEQAIAEMFEDSAALHELHEMQCWRLIHWRAARETLTYRRFFEIADLVGLKVESPRVFDEIHGRLGTLVAAGSVSGVRIDHIDGLADPKAYLERLQKTFADDGQLYLLVEKILGPDEELRSDWPVAGTTGYEFIASLAGLLIDPRGEATMTLTYCSFSGDDGDYQRLAMDAKRRTLARNFAGELDRLKEMASALAARHLASRDFGADTLRRAIIELVAALPVYRTYVDISGAQAEDKAILEAALSRAKASREVEDEEAIDFLVRVLKLDFEAPEDQASALEFATRFQQTSGPVMAKALEDTTFYRYNRLIALNEVGGAPDRFGAPVAKFHLAMERRLHRQGAALSSTATHDTKRGEDARARLYVLSEMPKTWAAAVERWAEFNAPLHRDLGGIPIPGRDVEWMFYQALAGAWPPDLTLDHAAILAVLSDRMTEYMLKAVREAKVHTSWTDQNAEYEDAVENFTRAALDPARAQLFLRDFVSTCDIVFRAGAVNSLSQTAIKLAAPGVPDIYQGTELWDLSLVDPDNRRPVDFDYLHYLQQTIDAIPVTALAASWRNGAIKMRLLGAGLKLRTVARQVFENGDYLPLVVAGKAADHVLAFARLLGSDAVVVIVPRLCLGLLGEDDLPLVPRACWKSTTVQVSDKLAGRRFCDVVTGEMILAPFLLGEVLQRFPVALLATQLNGQARFAFPRSTAWISSRV